MNTQQEIKNREFLIKELKKSLRSLEDRKAKQDSKHVNVYYNKKTGDTYYSEHEALDAYGGGMITRATYEKIRDFFEGTGEKQEDKYAFAIRYLNALVSNIIQECKDYDEDYNPFKIEDTEETEATTAELEEEEAKLKEIVSELNEALKREREAVQSGMTDEELSEIREKTDFLWKARERQRTLVYKMRKGVRKK